MAGVDVTGSAWDAGFLAWFSVLLLLAVAVVVALPHFGTEVPQRSMIWMIASGVAFVFILLRWLTYGSTYDPQWGLFIGLILALASAGAGFLAFRASPSTSPQTGNAYGA